MNDPLCERTRKRFKLAKAWISQWLPMFRRTHSEQVSKIVDGHAAYCKAVRAERDAGIADAEQRVTRVLDRLAKIDWHCYEHPTYRLQLLLNPTAFTYNHYPYDKRDLELMAHVIARQVECEIASSKFVEVALNNRRNAYRLQGRDFAISERF